VKKKRVANNYYKRLHVSIPGLERFKKFVFHHCKNLSRNQKFYQHPMDGFHIDIIVVERINIKVSEPAKK